MPVEWPVINTNLAWSSWVSEVRVYFSTGTASNTIWYNWPGTGATTQSALVYNEPYRITLTPADPQPDDEATLERLRQQFEELQQDNAERLRIRKERHERARQLLRSVLTDEQWADYEEHRRFYVVGSDGVRYLIENYASGNVTALLEDRHVRYCAHPRDYDADLDARLPVPDLLVGQVLALRTDAPEFLAVANIHGVWEPGDEERIVDSA